MKITDIKRQKRNPNRFNVFCDGKFSFAVSDKLLMEFNLFKDKEITKNEIENINGKNQEEKTYEYCLRLIQRRPRSISEIRQKLLYPTSNTRKKISAKEVQSTINKLMDKNFLNDKDFATWWIENRIGNRPRGKYLLSNELKQKGVNDEIIRSAIASSYPEDDTENVVKLAQKKLSKLKRFDKYEQKEKLTAFLMRKGFEYDKIRSVIDDLLK